MINKTRKLTLQDLQAFKVLRLEALKTNPESFGSHYARELTYEDAKFQRLLRNNANNFVFGAFDNEHIIAMAGFYVANDIGNIWGVFTKPEYRGQRISKHLMKKVLTEAKQMPNVQKIQLGVTSESPAAVGLYKSMGFVTYKVAEDPITHGDFSMCEILMELQL